MEKLELAYINILESSTVTMTPAASALYPEYRLSDRTISRLCVAGSAGNPTTIKIAQIGTPIAVNRLIIPSGHNLTGLTCTLSYSDDDSQYYTASSFSANAGDIVKSFNLAAHIYWKFTVANPTIPIELSELFLCPTYTFVKGPSESIEDMENLFNVENTITVKGFDRFLVMGNSKKQRKYKFIKVSVSEMESITSFYNTWAGSKPFYFKDHDGIWFYAKMDDLLNKRIDESLLYDFNFNVVEVIN